MRLQEFINEAKLPDYKKVKIGSKKWKQIWNKYPELQDEMLAWRKSKESSWLKSKEVTKFAVTEAYLSDMSRILKDMETVAKEMKKDNYPSNFVKQVEDISKQWRKLTTKLA